MPDRWRKIEAIFQDALRREPAERGRFLEQACADDQSLRKEIEGLLASHKTASAFLASFASDAESLIGRVFGPYELQSLLGIGGMGRVYQAWDSKLKRHVAIKVLPNEFSRDAQRVARFQREAEILASLNHPYVAAIHDVGQSEESPFLVLELIEGETLADRISRGPLSIAEGLHIAGQIAEALEAAHEKGIIHRDLKPANIKIMPDGNVKVLDFGLARMEADDADFPKGPTQVTVSAQAMIMGTAAYMSPEQARGEVVARQADIWAFGCVLYEMLTGRPAFAKETIPETLAKVLEGSPDFGALPSNTPSLVRRLLRRCLEKDSKGRLHDIADARIDIREAMAFPSREDATDSQPSALPGRHRGLRWASAFVLVLLAAVGIWLRARLPTSQPPAEVVRFEVTPAEAQF